MVNFEINNKYNISSVGVLLLLFVTIDVAFMLVSLLLTLLLKYTHTCMHALHYVYINDMMPKNHITM